MAIAILFPADSGEPLTVHDYRSLTHYRSALGGDIEIVPAGCRNLSFVSREAAAPAERPINVRATVLWWLHVPGVRNREILFGDVLLVGPVTPTGEVRDLPGAVEERLLAPASYVVQTREPGDRQWHVTLVDLDSYIDAATEALRLLVPGSVIDDVRVVQRS
ncbi:MAG: hypothetical protein DLM57_08080 [Pseudonocardiales bacterium]|nr:MAG: hypothetical protein DLM57_08080 [Pseudonocardiales bacterium]